MQILVTVFDMGGYLSYDPNIREGNGNLIKNVQNSSKSSKGLFQIRDL